MSRLSDHPLTVVIGILASLVTIIGFLGITNINKCSGAPEPEPTLKDNVTISESSKMTSDQKCSAFSFIGFIDVEVDSEKESNFTVNTNRVQKIIDPICKKYLLDDYVCSLFIKIYPLYYKTGEVAPIYFRERNITPSSLSLSNEQTLINKFYHSEQIGNFLSLYCGRGTPQNREIWRTVYRMADAIDDATGDSIMLVYYSDFLEKNSQPDIEESKYSFVLEHYTGQMLLDCHMIQQANLDLIDNKKPLGQALSQFASRIQGAVRGRKVKIVLIKRNSNVINEDCTFNELENYWTVYFKKLGFAVGDITWLSDEEFNENFLTKIFDLKQ